jgi:hypothetical protein
MRDLDDPRKKSKAKTFALMKVNKTGAADRAALEADLVLLCGIGDYHWICPTAMQHWSTFWAKIGGEVMDRRSPRRWS